MWVLCKGHCDVAGNHQISLAVLFCIAGLNDFLCYSDEGGQ